MDAEQFAKFLSVPQAQQEQMLKILTTVLAHTTTQVAATATSADGVMSASIWQQPSDRMATNKVFSLEKYNPANYRVSDYIYFFETKCTIYGVTTDDTFKKDLLLTCITPDILREVKTAITPNFETSTYTTSKGHDTDI